MLLRNPSAAGTVIRNSMTTLSVCLFACVLLLLTRGIESSFYYTKSISMFRRTTDEECKLCYGDDCVSMNQARCEYNMAIGELLEDKTPLNLITPQNNKLKLDIDTMMYNFVAKASSLASIQCIPLISVLTDCTKENMCLGCRTCSCSENGQWQCTVQRHCHVEMKSGIDHRDIMMTIESLGNENQNQYRKKREVTTNMANDTDGMTYVQLSNWLYTTDPLNKGKITQQRIKDIPARAKTMELTSTDEEELGFDEVMKNIAENNNTEIKKTNTFKPNNEDNYMEFYMHELTKGDTTSNIDDVETTTDAASPLVEIETTSKIDDPFDINNEIDIEYKEEKNNSVNPILTISDVNYINDVSLNTVNVMKRDVSKVLPTNITGDISNSTDTVDDLKDNVLYPLNDIVSEKQNELQELMLVRDSLITIIKSLNNKTSISNEHNKTVAHNRTPQFSIYKLQILRPYQPDYKRSDSSTLDKYLTKLKRDIFEVVRDIVEIQRITKPERLPSELNMLVRAMKRYIHKQNDIDQPKLDVRKQSNNNSTRDRNTIKGSMMEIFALIAKESSETNMFNSLSKKSKIILGRILRQNHYEQFSIANFVTDDTSDIFKNMLSNINSKWEEFADKVSKSSPFDLVYNLKLLHLILSVDINKLSDAMKVLEFTKNRRMNIDYRKLYKVLYEIDKRLDKLNDTAQRVRELKQKNRRHLRKYAKNITETKRKPKKKLSFLKQIKNLLRSSKGVINKGTAKSDIVKTLAENKLNELTRRRMNEYEDVMQKWQNNLQVRRKKRSTKEFVQGLKHRISNILPKYLRRKVPTLAKKNKSKAINVMTS